MTRSLLDSPWCVTRSSGGRPDDRAHAIGLYEENIRMVKAAIAPERLLVHNLGDGWQPLCAFLGLPVPEQPYPSLNAAKDFQDANLKSTSR
ncbi:sulfotransferase [uncultured Amphritea sp.]|uniref:sulfotransferase n=1 Tax=uncultured Amphritea sp. TaxID=981605 RepID=UPI00344D1BC0